MKIAIDISPLQTEHKVRGVGFYIEHLKQALTTYFPDNTYLFSAQNQEIPTNVDLVHYPYFDPFFLTLPLVKKHKRVVTVHDMIPLLFPRHFPAGIKGNLKWQLQKYNLQNSDSILVNSESTKKDVVKLTGIDEKSVNVTYLAAGEEFEKIGNEKQKKEILQKYNLPEKFVLYVGDVTWNKNLPRLIKAIKELNLTLVMVGKALAQKKFDTTNPWNHDLVEINKLVESDNRFIRLGFVPTKDPTCLYNSATVFALPSLYEGFGFPLLEAMQCGCPIVTTDNGALQEIADQAAFYVDGENIQSIVRGIEKVFFTGKLQETLRRKGFEQAKNFTWRKTAEETIEVYKKVLGIKY